MEEKEYEVVIKMKFRSTVSKKKIINQINTKFCLSDVEISNELSTNDIYWTKDFDIIEVKEIKKLFEK